ncbi:MAG: DegT/DnrJ/EryC1/StrS family aminotransferase [Candidatus Ratteibacteria bacterium]
MKLAIFGGEKAVKKDYSEYFKWPIITKEMEEKVLDVLRKGAMSGIELTKEFEKEYANLYGMKYALCHNNGTAAIHSALFGLKIGKGDEVICPSMTYWASCLPILSLGGTCVFADIDEESLCIDPDDIERHITEKTKAIVVVHYAGYPADMEKIMSIAKKYNLKLIEDCAQSHASIYKGRYVGTFGDIGVFSLMSGKHITSGGQGGMIITDNEEYYWRSKRFADRGKPFGMENPKGNVSLGLNYRMTEIQAAIGRIQLKKIKKIAEKRFKIVEELRNGFKNFKAFSLWKRPDNSKPNYWFCFVRVDEERLKYDKYKIAEILRKEGLPVGAHYVIPMYENPFIKERKTFGSSGYPFNPYAQNIEYKCSVAEKALNSHITLYINECWTKKEVEDTIKIFERVEKVCLR